MKILIIEDERPAASRLTKMIKKERGSAEIIEVIDSVETAVKWLGTFETPELIFMDIQLADGISFDIFKQVKVEAPVIFTTAYDQFMLKAFKVNSVDYLLKPIDPEELKAAIEKYEKIYHQEEPSYDSSVIERLVNSIAQKDYKERFLVKIGQQLTYVSVDDIAYFYSEEGMVHAKNNAGKQYILDYTLDQLEKLINPKYFFRINRKFITRLNSIHKIHTYFNSRLKLELLPRIDMDIIVSRDRVNDFKNWLDQ